MNLDKIYICFFNLGKTTNAEWKKTIKNYPALWGELRIPEYLTMTFPSFQMKLFDNMEALAKFYEKFMKTFVYFMGTTKMQKEERVVYDIQIEAGMLYILLKIFIKIFVFCNENITKQKFRS